MRFNSKYLNLKTIYIFFLFLALLNIFFSTDKVQGKTFIINDIKISTPFEINFDKKEIIDKGFIQAFDQLILSIVRTQDQKKLRKIPISMIKGMIETFSIKKEKFIDETYHLNLSVSFNKKKIFNLLQEKNIFPSLPIKKDIFFIPIVIEEDKNEILIFSENYLFNNWNKIRKNYHLINYILPTEDLEDLDLIKIKLDNLEDYDFQEIINKYNLKDYIIMIVFKNTDRIKILSKINLNNNLNIKTQNFQSQNFKSQIEIEKFINKIKNVYENYWKTKNQINTSLKFPIIVSIDNNDNSKISKFEKSVKELDFLYDFYIYKFDNKRNIYKIIFNGSPENFLKTMNKNNYNFDTQNHIWTLR